MPKPFPLFGVAAIPKRSRITENSRSGNHDHVDFSPDGDLAVKYTENSTRGENSPPKIGHTALHFMITLTFRQATGKFATIMTAPPGEQPREQRDASEPTRPWPLFVDERV
ncbi:MAG TPA: hypothetical protein VFI65_12830 [Streptosporangiaceae bacterium]|nr:hypothetical protein [Streptosporangiaceae bacterium]